MPEGTFYMDEHADETYNLSKIDEDTADEIISDNEEATALSIQMGFVNDADDKQSSVAFVTSTNPGLFPEVADGEIILDESLKENGIEVGDKLTNAKSLPSKVLPNSRSSVIPLLLLFTQEIIKKCIV